MISCAAKRNIVKTHAFLTHLSQRFGLCRERQSDPGGHTQPNGNGCSQNPGTLIGDLNEKKTGKIFS